MTPAQQDLAARYIPFALSLARPWKRAFATIRDEFESAALFALVQAAAVYDPERGVRFGSFASYRIVGAMYDVQRKMVARARRRHGGKNPSRLPLSTIIAEKSRRFRDSLDPHVGADIDEADELECWLRRLPSREARPCRMMILEEKTRRETARLLRSSPSRISWRVSQAIERLRQMRDVREARAEMLGGTRGSRRLANHGAPSRPCTP